METNRIEDVLLKKKQSRNKERKTIKYKEMLKNCDPDQTFLIVIFVTSAGKKYFLLFEKYQFAKTLYLYFRFFLPIISLSAESVVFWDHREVPILAAENCK